MSISDLFKKIVTQGVSNTSCDDVVKLACAFWHESYVPDLDEIKSLPVKQQQVVGYLIGFFSVFYIVEKERAIMLTKISENIKLHIRFEENATNPDDIAAMWGLEDNLDECNKDKLYYQTRHYVHPVQK